MEVRFVQAEVTANRRISDRYLLLSLLAPEVTRRVRPGQFVMLNPFRDGEPLLPRPMAVYATSPDGTFEVLYMVVGRGTACLARLPAGAPCRVLGPLGVPWQTVPDADIHVAVGGGTGLAALRIFLRALGARRCLFLIGARDRGGLLEAPVLDLPGVSVSEATDDGSRGYHGTVVELLERWLAGAARRAALYAAGPVPMMAAVARLAAGRGLPCRVSLEALMACGLGVCRACVVDALGPHGKTGLLRRAVCVDGPVFDAAALDWSKITAAGGP